MHIGNLEHEVIRGGWRFSFRSPTQARRCVRVNDKGDVVTNEKSSYKGERFKKPPALSIQKATVAAQRKYDSAWTVILCVWIEDHDEWQARLVNNQRQAVTLVVDSEGNATKLGHSVEDCLYKAKHGMAEHIALVRQKGLPVPAPNRNPRVTIQNAQETVVA